MFKKAVLLLLLVAVAVQASVPYDEDDESGPIVDEHGEVAVHKLAMIIARSAREAWEKLHKELNEKVRENIRHSEAKVEKEVHLLFGQIKKLEGEAQKDKVDVKACVETKQEHELKHISREFRKKVFACDRQLITQSREAAKKEMKTVLEAFHLVKELGHELRHCERAEESRKCIAKVTAEIAKADHALPAKIQKTIDAVIPTIHKLVPASEKCVAKEATEFVAKEKKLAAVVETCIQNKIHHKH